MSQVEVGKTYREVWPLVNGKPNVHNKLIHVRGKVDDQYIIRWWRPSKQRWEYICEPDWHVESLIKKGTWIPKSP